MQKVNELNVEMIITDLVKLENIDSELMMIKTKLQRVLEIVTEDLKRQQLGQDIPDVPDDKYGHKT